MHVNYHEIKLIREISSQQQLSTIHELLLYMKKTYLELVSYAWLQLCDFHL